MNPIEATYSSYANEYRLDIIAPHKQGDITKIYIPTMSGNIDVIWLNSSMQSQGTLSVSLSEHIAEITCPSDNAYYYRIAGVNAYDRCYKLLEVQHPNVLSEIEDASIKNDNNIIGIKGGNKKSIIASEYLPGPQAYGFFIPVSEYEINSVISVYIKDMPDGSYNVALCDNLKRVMANVTAVFENGYTSILINLTSVYYIRINNLALNTYSKCVILENTHGALNENRLPELRSFYEGEITGTISAEYVAGPQHYCLFVPVVGSAEDVMVVKCLDIPDGTYTAVVADINKQRTGGLDTFDITFKDGISKIALPIGAVGDYVRIVDTIHNSIQKDTKCYILQDYPGDLEDLRSYSKEIGIQSTINCLPYIMVGKSDDQVTLYPKYNIIVPTDFHKVTSSFANVCKWTKDEVINIATQVMVVAGDYINYQRVITHRGCQLKCNLIMNTCSITDKPILFVQGNHDGNWEGNTVSGLITHSELREWIYNPMYNRLSDADKANFTWGNSGDVNNPALYYSFKKRLNQDAYGDLTCKFICLDEYETPAVSIDEYGHLKYNGTGLGDNPFSTYLTKEQMQFIVAELTNAADTDTVIIVKHTPLGDNSLAGCNEALATILKGYKNRTSGSVTVSSLESYESYTINFDFSSKSESHIMMITGHWHYTHLYTPDDSANVYGIYDLVGCATSWGGGRDIKAQHSITETNCDIVSINPTNNRFMVLRYGVAKKANGQTDSWLGLENPYQL